MSRGSENWEEANEYCKSLTLAEYDDWRLPTLLELETIVEYNNQDVLIDEEVFEDTTASHFWTSSKYQGKDNMHWYIHFEKGHQGYAFNFKEGYQVRCIRDNTLIDDLI
jgi:hypothetical protein